MTVLKTCVSLAASLITGTPLDVSRAAAVDSGQKALLVDNNNSPVLRPASLSPLHDHKANAAFRCYSNSSSQAIPNGTPSPCTTLKSDQANGYVNGHTKVFSNVYVNGCVNGHVNGFTNGHANGCGNGYATGLNGHIPSTVTRSSHIKSHQPQERWVRPLGYAERCMSKAHDYGCMTTVYSLWLSSKAPLDFESIQRAADIMYRKMPNLRMRMSRRGKELWWKESPQATLDVEELVTDNIEASVESLLQRPYNLEDGPLWFARFVTLPKSDNSEDDKDFTHKYVCIFGFHHNASDGTSNMKFCKVFLKVLNDLAMGKEVDMKEEGTFAVPLQDALGDQIHTLWFFINVFFKRLFTAILTFGISVRNFTRLFQMPAAIPAATHILQHEFDEVTTKKLISRCKMEGVTLNSAFTAAANLSMYEMMISRNAELDETSLCSQQAINMRRYWPQELQPNTLGCHISLLDISFPTKRSDLHSFWEYARDINKRLQHMLIEEQRPLKLQPMSERLIILIRHNSWLAWLGLPSANDNHYTVTNMGNLHTTFPGVGEAVEATKVLRSVSCHFMPTLCQHTLQTFRGRFCYSLDYYTQKLSKETATTYAQGIMDWLRKSIHSPN